MTLGQIFAQQSDPGFVCVCMPPRVWSEWWIVNWLSSLKPADKLHLVRYSMITRVIAKNMNSLAVSSLWAIEPLFEVYMNTSKVMRGGSSRILTAACYTFFGFHISTSHQLIHIFRKCNCRGTRKNGFSQQTGWVKFSKENWCGIWPRRCVCVCAKTAHWWFFIWNVLRISSRLRKTKK